MNRDYSGLQRGVVFRRLLRIIESNTKTYIRKLPIKDTFKDQIPKYRLRTNKIDSVLYLDILTAAPPLPL